MFRLKDNVNSLDPKKSISGEYEKQKKTRTWSQWQQLKHVSSSPFSPAPDSPARISNSVESKDANALKKRLLRGSKQMSSRHNCSEREFNAQQKTGATFGKMVRRRRYSYFPLHSRVLRFLATKGKPMTDRSLGLLGSLSRHHKEISEITAQTSWYRGRCFSYR